MEKTNCTGSSTSCIWTGATADDRCDRRSLVSQPLGGHLMGKQVTLIVKAMMESSTKVGAGAAIH